jgi:hypothetical protein
MSVSFSGSGQVVSQVIQTYKSSAFTTTTTGSWVDVTGLTVTITPRNSSNKVMVNLSICASAENEQCAGRLLRNGTAIATGDAVGSATLGTFYILRMLNIGTDGSGPTNGVCYLDSPATTSAVTYSVQIYSPSGRVGVNQSSNNSSAGSTASRMISTITAMEIAYA